MDADRETKAELEREIAALIRKRLPKASEFVDVEVDLRERDSGASGEIRVAFTASENGLPDAVGAPSPRRRDILERLAQSELRLGYEFISLDWFLDCILPETFPWARDQAARRQELNAAIQDGAILAKGKSYDPPEPARPLAIRVNRDHPEAADIVADAFGPDKGKAWGKRAKPSPTIYPEEVDEETMRRAFDFEPVKTRSGKSAAEIVMENRRAGW